MSAAPKAVGGRRDGGQLGAWPADCARAIGVAAGIRRLGLALLGGLDVPDVGAGLGRRGDGRKAEATG